MLPTQAIYWHAAAGFSDNSYVPFAGAAVLRMSSNGRCCSIVWPEARRYAVYAQGGSDDWHKVDEESGTSVAWAGASSTYAVLHKPRVSGLHLWCVTSNGTKRPSCMTAPVFVCLSVGGWVGGWDRGCVCSGSCVQVC